MRFEPSSVPTMLFAGDFSSVNVSTGIWEPRGTHSAAVLMGQEPLGVEGLTCHPNAKGLALSILIGMQFSLTLCEGRDSLCFSYWPMEPQLGQCQPPRLAHPGRRGEEDV